MFSLRHFCSRFSFINCLDSGNSTDTYFRFSVFFVFFSFLLASAQGLNPKYPSVSFALKLIENFFLMQTAFNAMIGCKIPRSSAFPKNMCLIIPNTAVNFSRRVSSLPLLMPFRARFLKDVNS